MYAITQTDMVYVYERATEDCVRSQPRVEKPLFNVEIDAAKRDKQIADLATNGIKLDDLAAQARALRAGRAARLSSQ